MKAEKKLHLEAEVMFRTKVQIKWEYRQLILEFFSSFLKNTNDAEKEKEATQEDYSLSTVFYLTYYQTSLFMAANFVNGSSISKAAGIDITLDLKRPFPERMVEYVNSMIYHYIRWLIMHYPLGTDD